MSERCVCIHGHFYQPPRENPWLEEIERQESARPYHDWNERVCRESYAPNAFSRILDGEGRIIRIVNNYSRMSFNFGPTLLSWMVRSAPTTYEAILKADRASRERFSGYGSAIAQAHDHLILPLANSRDKRTQVLWGIRDFEGHFQRRPEGMWLPETAVDLETLDIMAGEGIRFTILAPHQAAEVRGEGVPGWADVRGERVDTRAPYRVELPSGRDITVFFYDGPLSRAVAFEEILVDGDEFARRLREFGGEGPPALLRHIATDGETFGHHHKHGEMALSYALNLLEADASIRLTNYAEFLAHHPPEREARILENSSWSCVHGVERWRANCGCTTGGHPDWSQEWRRPLRKALDWLRDELAPRFEGAAREYFEDPWATRDRYIEVVADRDWEDARGFIAAEAGRSLSREEEVRALQLLELQRHAMLMFTSCGWFFDDLARIETLQVMRYAARALHLARGLFDVELEGGLCERLAEARSNVPALGNGAVLFRARVQPGQVTLKKVAAHYTMTSLFQNGEEESTVYCYGVRVGRARRMRAEGARCAVGWIEVYSRITHFAGRFTYGVLHTGDHNLIGGVRPFSGVPDYREVEEAITSAFEAGRIADVPELLGERFPDSMYTLGSLFRDEQERVVDRILEDSLADAERTLAGIYESRMPLMRFLADHEIPQPIPFRAAGEFILGLRLVRALSADPPDLEGARRSFEEVRATGVRVERDAVSMAAAQAVERMMHGVSGPNGGPEGLRAVLGMVDFVRSLPFPVELWGAQNTYFRLLEEVYPGFLERAAAGDRRATEWSATMEALGEGLQVAVPQIQEARSAPAPPGGWP